MESYWCKQAHSSECMLDIAHTASVVSAANIEVAASIVGTAAVVVAMALLFQLGYRADTSSGSGVAKSFGALTSISKGRVSKREHSWPYLKQFPLYLVSKVGFDGEWCGRTRREQLHRSEHAFPCILRILSLTSCEAFAWFGFVAYSATEEIKLEVAKNCNNNMNECCFDDRQRPFESMAPNPNWSLPLGLISRVLRLSHRLCSE